MFRIKPALNQNTMIRLLPIIHSWKCPETWNLCSVTIKAGLWWGGYKRGLAEQRSLQVAGLFLSRAGLFLARTGLFWPHQWIPRISPIQPSILHCQASKAPSKNGCLQLRGDLGNGIGLPHLDFQRDGCFPLQSLNYKTYNTPGDFQCSPLKLLFNHVIPPMLL